jgi:hypothetical protein
MDKNEIIALIKKTRDEYRDRSLAAGPGTTDAGIIDSARLAWKFAEEYDRLLAAIENAEAGKAMEGVLGNSVEQSYADNFPASQSK